MTADLRDPGRRAFLVRLAALGVGASLGLDLTGCGGADDDAALPPHLDALFRDGSAARAVGAAMLRAAPEWEDRDVLARALFADPGWRTASAEQTAQRLAERVRADFEAGRTVAAERWVLAESEARLYALLELLGRDASS